MHVFRACMRACAMYIVCGVGSYAQSGELTPARLQCEYLENPVGIDEVRPRFSWIDESNKRGSAQSAYQILVASSAHILKSRQGDMWDTDRVASSETIHIAYAGKTLRSGARYYWSVRVWDAHGKPSPFSAVAFFETALLQPDDWLGAKWIARSTETHAQPAPLLRRTFEVKKKLSRARAYVSGLGYYEFSLNGTTVGNHRLDPAYTRYDRRVLYVTYDITRYMKAGKNSAGIMLGNGWFNVHTRAAWDFHKAPWREAPKALVLLCFEYRDGSVQYVRSDATWKTASGPVTFNSIYEGETYDARLELADWDTPRFDDSLWHNAREVLAPHGRLTAQMLEPIVVTETRGSAKVFNPLPGMYVFDFGANIAGVAALTLRAQHGDRITLRYGEQLAGDGRVLQRGIGHFVTESPYGDPAQRFQTDVYIAKGIGTERWEARFTYHGFRYVEVSGLREAPGDKTLYAHVLHTAVRQVGRFASSNTLLNRIWENTLRSYRSNVFGIPTDCPHREKNGWTGDAHLAAEQALFNFATGAFYTKWIADIGDEQQLSGELPGIVPTGGWGYAWGNGPAWDSAFTLIPWYLYTYHGDTRILQTHYAGMKRYVDYLQGKAEQHIVSIGLGDWVPFKTETPVAVTSTAYYYLDAVIVSRAAMILGYADDAARYAALAERIKLAFQKTFIDAETGRVANGSQTALGCALSFGLVEPEMREHVTTQLIAAIERADWHLDVGVLGAKCVPEALYKNGRTDVAYRVVSQRTMPGWGYWVMRGATSLWETWNEREAEKGDIESRNHIMFGDIAAWFTKALAGINPDPDFPGFAHFTIAPHPAGELTHAEASYDSIRGMIRSSWRKRHGVFELSITIPANTTATVFLPASPRDMVFEGGSVARDARGVQFLRREKDDRAVFMVGSGIYTFRVVPYR